MSRTPQEVFQHHAEVLVAGDVDGIVSDYSDDAVIITQDGVKRGKDGVREAFVELLGHVPQAEWEIKSAVYEGEHMLLHWAADSEKATVDDGVDTFMFVDGQIVMQTLHATFVPKG